MDKSLSAACGVQQGEHMKLCCIVLFFPTVTRCKVYEGVLNILFKTHFDVPQSQMQENQQTFGYIIYFHALQTNQKGDEPLPKNSSCMVTGDQWDLICLDSKVGPKDPGMKSFHQNKVPHVWIVRVQVDDRDSRNGRQLSQSIVLLGQIVWMSNLQQLFKSP